VALSYLQTVLADSPNTLWMLSETSGTFADSTGNGVVMTAHGSITRSVDTGFAGVGKGVSFGGTSSDFIDTPANPLTRPGSALSYECWVKPASFGANQCMMGLTAVAAVDGIGFGILSSGTKLFAFNTNSGVTICSGLTSLVAATEYYVVLAGTGAGGSPWKIYLNGVDDTNTSSASGISAPAGSFNLGIDNGSLLPMRAGGALCACAIYPSVLSGGQVATHYAARNSVGGSPDILLPMSVSGQLRT
jgi:concanavalin A-like lectin/glucanase superfamily protein